MEIILKFFTLKYITLVHIQPIKRFDIFMSYSRKLNVCMYIRESMIPKMRESLFHLLRHDGVTCDKMNFFILFATHTHPILPHVQVFPQLTTALRRNECGVKKMMIFWVLA